MNEIMAIAGSTWRRILRMKVVYFLIVCVWILIGSAMNYDILSLGEEKELMIDVSLLLNTIAIALIVISVTFEIPRELHEGAAATMLTKPLGRTQYLVGKFLGSVITAIIIGLIIAAGFFVLFYMVFGEPLIISLLQAHLLIIASSIPMTAIAVLFSMILPEMITPIITAIALWFSFSTSHLAKYGFMKIIYGGVLPDLDLFNFKSAAMITAGWSYVAMAAVWGAIFSVFALTLSSLIFRFKDIK
ncbi:MAG: hypothetical protein JXR78_08165 [Victivallales bacterium]|nr:hypothetical protein [Victivallales bacterium]